MPGCCNPSPNPAGMPLVGENPSSLCFLEEEEQRYSEFPRAGQAVLKPAGTALGEGRSCAEREGNSRHSYSWEGGIQVKHHPEVDSKTLASISSLKLNSGLFFFWSGLRST